MKEILFFGLLLAASLAPAQSVIVGPYLQSPTQTTIKVKWRTASATVSTVRYGTALGNLNQVWTDTALVTWHTAQVTGLQPFTRYYYAIYNGSTLVEGDDSLHTFRTWPSAGTPTHLRAWVIGDFGKGNDKEARVRDSYDGWDSEETDLWLWLGDNVYDNGLEQEYIDKVFDSVWGYQQLMKRQPFLPCPGNHDYNTISPVQNPQPPLQHTGPYYDFVDVYQGGEAGGLATGHELFYSYDYGNVHFVSLNSELGSLFNSSDDWIGIYPFGSFSGSPMTQWLHADLTANTQLWTIIYFHQPPYTDGSHDAGAFWEVYMQAMRENFAEIWEQYGVDLVLCGHSHVYERSYLVHGAYGNASQINSANFVQQSSGIEALGEAYTKYTQGPGANTGTVYVVQGNSAASDNGPSFQHPYMFAEVGCDTCCGSFVLDVDSNRLDGRHIDMMGNVLDHFTILKTFGPVSLENEVVRMEISIAPNPVSSLAHVRFTLPASSQVDLQLSDITGRTWPIFKGELAAGAQSLTMDVERMRLAAGYYIAQLRVGDARFSRSVQLQ
jgi:acid phosphatase type 7